MATGTMFEVNKAQVKAYKIAQRKARKNGMGVVSIMGVSNGRGAKARHAARVKATITDLKPVKATKKVGGLEFHTGPTPEYRKKGAVAPEHYALPQGYRYPIHGKTKKQSKAFVLDAMTRFPAWQERYSPKVRKEIAYGIARGAAAIGLETPKASEYRKRFRLNPAGGEMIFLKRNKKSAKKRGRRIKVVGYKAVANKKTLRRNLVDRWAEAEYGETVERSGVELSSISKATVASIAKPPSKREIRKLKNLLKKANKETLAAVRAKSPEQAAKGKALAAKIRQDINAKTQQLKSAEKLATMKAREKKMAKKAKKAVKGTKKAIKKTRKTRKGKMPAGLKKYWASKKAAKKVAKKSRKVARKAPKARKTVKRSRKAAAKKAARTRAANKARRSAAAKKAARTRKAGKGRKVARKAAKRHVKRHLKRHVARKAPKARKTRKVRRVKRNAKRSYRRNDMMAMVKNLFQPALAGTGGFIVHSMIANALTKFAVDAGITKGGKSIASLVTLLAGAFATSKVAALAPYSTPVLTGMAVSAVRNIINDLAPTAGTAIGLGASEIGTAQDYRPRYHLGEYYQPAAGMGEYYQPTAGFEEAAAGTGEYFSQDLLAVSGAGEYYLPQMSVQGFSDYEVQPQYSSATAGMGMIEGTLPTDNMDATFNMMEAAAGLGAAGVASGPSPAGTSTYVPYERSLAVANGEETVTSGIFDIGGTNGILS